MLTTGNLYFDYYKSSMGILFGISVVDVGINSWPGSYSPPKMIKNGPLLEKYWAPTTIIFIVYMYSVDS